MSLEVNQNQLQAFVDGTSVPDGTLATQSASRDGAARVVQAHGEHYEGNRLGRIFSACIGAAGVAPGTALSTTPAFQLYNPTGSAKGLVVLETRIGYLSGTLGAGVFVYSYYNAQPSAPTTGTALVAVCGNMTAKLPASGAANTGSTIAGTAVIVRPLGVMGASLASTANPISDGICDRPNGSIMILPGRVLCVQSIAAAGTTPLVIISMTWEEVPLNSTDLALTT